MYYVSIHVKLYTVDQYMNELREAGDLSKLVVRDCCPS